MKRNCISPIIGFALSVSPWWRDTSPKWRGLQKQPHQKSKSSEAIDPLRKAPLGGSSRQKAGVRGRLLKMTNLFTKGQNKSTLHGVLVCVPWRPAHAATRTKKALCPITTISPCCPRDLYGSQNDKHSDLTFPLEKSYGNGCCRGFAPRFPYPRASRHTVRPTTNRESAPMNCVYSFVAPIIAQIKPSVNPFKKIRGGFFLFFLVDKKHPFML